MSIGEREFVTDQGRRLPFRPGALDPRNPNCPAHLRRLCGNCEGFPPEAEMRAAGQFCAKLQIRVNGSSSADKCNLWVRKVAPSQKSKGAR